MEEFHSPLRKTIEALLKLMGFTDVTVAVATEASGEGIIIAIESPDASLLIGEYGEHLRALEYVAKLIARKTLLTPPRFFVDVNRYRQGRIEALREYAREAASRVTREGREVVMEPMTSYERRAVHMELSSRPDITTESIGEGTERRVVVKPYP